MSTLYPRWQKNVIAQALKNRRVLLLSGARQCGKTTLARQLVSAQTAYRTLDDLTLKKLAESDPQDFVTHEFRTLVIDEIQRVPELLSAIKLIVDRDNRPGQFLLTGSANIQTLPSVKESLAGRIQKLRLRPLAQGEILESKPKFLEKAYNLSSFKRLSTAYDRRAILDMAFRGGYPEAIQLSARERK